MQGSRLLLATVILAREMSLWLKKILENYCKLAELLYILMKSWKWANEIFDLAQSLKHVFSRSLINKLNTVNCVTKRYFLG
jgi:hypothetical protein